MSKNSTSDFGMYYMLPSHPKKDQFVILYFVDDPKSSGHSSVSRVSLHPPTYTYSNMMLRGHIL